MVGRCSRDFEVLLHSSAETLSGLDGSPRATGWIEGDVKVANDASAAMRRTRWSGVIVTRRENNEDRGSGFSAHPAHQTEKFRKRSKI